MIGAITFRIDPAGAPVRAELGDDGVWTCPDEPDVERMLNRADRPDASPAAGRFGVAAIYQAARVLGGTVELPPRPPGKPGTVY